MKASAECHGGHYGDGHDRKCKYVVVQRRRASMNGVKASAGCPEGHHGDGHGKNLLLFVLKKEG